MDELVKLVVQKAGITEEQARKAIETVAGYVKAKLPPAFAAQVDTVMNGGTPDLGSALGGLGGLFGKR